MKAKIINGKIKRYNQLPKYYKQWAGGFTEQSNIIHEQEGFFDVIKPKIDSDIEILGEIFFDTDKNIFTYPVLQLELDLETERTDKLAAFEREMDREMKNVLDLVVFEKLVMGESIPQETKDAITSLRLRKTEIIDTINKINNPKSLRKFKFVAGNKDINNTNIQK